MAARYYIVTGATAGIGVKIAEGLSRQAGAHVTLVGRNEAKCKFVLESLRKSTGNKNLGPAHFRTFPPDDYFLIDSSEYVFSSISHLSPAYDIADLSSYKDVMAFAKRYRDSGKPLHALVNNAGTRPSILFSHL